MSKKSNPELPGVEGKGVSPLCIEDIEKKIAKYEKKKDARCAESPGEIAAKKELREALHAHRDELPVTEDGTPFYRYDGKDYLLKETLATRKVVEEDNED